MSTADTSKPSTDDSSRLQPDEDLPQIQLLQGATSVCASYAGRDPSHQQGVGKYPRKSFHRTPPAIIPSLDRLSSTEPLWGQRFIYMSLIEGETLQERWGGMNEDERRAVCEELKHMAKAWRALEQDRQDRYIGSLGKQPLNEIFLTYHLKLAGPFEGANAVQQFQDACGIKTSGEVLIVFTHDDLVAPNVLLSPGPNPKVAAVIDWGQAGWYPAYWEYCKARWVMLNPEYFGHAIQEEWRTKYLPTVLEPVDDETYYHPWLYFVLSKGI